MYHEFYSEHSALPEDTGTQFFVNTSYSLLDPVLKQAGLRQFLSKSLSNCFKQAMCVAPFNVDNLKLEMESLSVTY